MRNMVAAPSSELAVRLSARFWPMLFLLLSVLWTKEKVVAADDQELDCEAAAPIKTDVIENLLERELQIKTKAGSQFQLDCRAEYFPDVTAVSVTWKKERREQFQCGVDSQLKSFGNASADQIPHSMLRCYKEGEMDDGRTSTWKIGSILQICNVSKAHEGSYVCEVCDEDALKAKLVAKSRRAPVAVCRLAHYQVVLTQPTKFSSFTIFFFAHPAVVPSGIFLFGLTFAIMTAMFCRKPNRTKGGAW